MKNKTLFGYFILSGVFLIFDRFFKLATTSYFKKELLVNKYFGWEPFLNTGAAFGIPMPRLVVVPMTFLIMGAVWYFYLLNKKSSSGNTVSIKVGMALIYAGAFSNLFDRIIFNYTIDYIRIFNGVINFADIFIVAGFVLYFSGLSEDSKE